MTRRSWLFFAGLCLVLSCLMVLPLLLFSWLTAHFLHGMLPAHLREAVEPDLSAGAAIESEVESGRSAAW